MSSICLAVVVVSLMVPGVARAADGAVHLYLQPLPPDAGRLAFSIGSVSAVSDSGSEHPLKLRLNVVGRAEVGRQRLLASGRLPVGGYSGFVFTVKQASVKRSPGEAALAVPDAPIRVDVPYTVARAPSPVVWLALKYEDSVAGGYGFTPVFASVTPPRSIADHNGFVSNSSSNTITVFDKNLMQAVGVIETCAGPAGLTLDQRRRRLYVACSKDDEIQSIDAATGEVIERSRVSPGDRPRELALSPDGTTLIAVNPGSNSISFFDALTLNRQERVNVGSGPGSVLMEPGGRRAFVFNTLSSSLSVVDVASRRVVATVSTESSPLRGQFNRRGDRLYVIHERSPYMTVFDPRQLTLVTRARLRIGVSAIDVDEVRDLVCIGGSNDTAIDFYDPNALMPLYSMRTGAGVSYLAVVSEDNTVYMVSPETRSLVVARLADRKLVSEIDVSEGPYQVAVMGEK